MNGEKIGGGDDEMNRGTGLEWNEQAGVFETAEQAEERERKAAEIIKEGKERAEKARKTEQGAFNKRVKDLQQKLQNDPNKIYELIPGDKEKAEWYKNNPDKIGQLLEEMDAKAEAYKEEHPEVVQEVGHQTTEAVDMDAAWEAYADGTINPEVAEQRAAVEEYNNDQAEIAADEERARREEQFNDAIHYWTDVEREQKQEGGTPEGGFDPLTADEFADHVSDGGDPNKLLNSWKDHIINQRAKAQEKLSKGEITQEEYEQLQKHYEDVLAKNEAAYKEYTEKHGEKNPDIAKDDAENISLKENLKEKANAKGELIEGEEGGVKKGFWAWLGRRIGDDRVYKIKKAAVTAGLIATSFLAGLGIVKTGETISGRQNVAVEQQVGGDEEENEDGGEAMTDEEVAAAVAAAEAVEPMTPKEAAEDINRFDEQMERERKHSVRVELPGGEIIEVNYEDHRGGYDETRHSWNDENKISRNATSGVLFEGEWTPGQSEEQVLEGYEKVLGVSPESSILLLAITGQVEDIDSLQDINTLSATLQEGDTDGYDALVNAAKNYLGEQMNNGRVNFFDINGAYHTTYTARDGSGRFMIYGQPDQRHNETIHAFDIINEEGVAMLNNAETLEKVKDILGISADENIRLGISGHCSQLVVEWVGGKGIEFAREVTAEEQKEIENIVTPPPERETPPPEQETPPPEQETPPPERETPPPQLQPKGPNSNDGGNNTPMGPTETIPEAIVATEDNRVEPNVQPGSQVEDVITDNPEITPDTSGWQEGAPAEQGAPTITEAPVESQAAPESASENTAPSTDEQLAEQLGDRF